MLKLKSALITGLVAFAAVAQEAAVTTPAPSSLTPPLKNFCDSMKKKFDEYKWGDPACEDYNWNHVRNSDIGTPLIWTVFGEEKSEAAANTTIILCGVHGDEITPVKFCWDLLKELKNNHTFKDKVVVVAPLVAPDSFLKARPSRTNGRGVDVNRNFPTGDWLKEAHRKWKQAYRSDKRKFPGNKAASEQETVFQMNLVLRYKPNKIVSVHAPLTLLDYDGPSLTTENGKPAKALLDGMSEKSANYKVFDYPVFPGSLGNWAGKEKGIPTYTLELPNINPAETDKFWGMFKDAVFMAIDHTMKNVSEPIIPETAEATEKKPK
ncbi:MAG: M14 family zinc carboxypeptidase [Bacteriovoracaceae bacterium]